MPEQAITSLALLKVFWDAQQDYVGNFIPFICECLRVAPQDEISLPALQESVRNKFGIDMPEGALKTIVKKAVKSGFVVVGHQIFRRTKQCIESTAFSEARSDALRKGNALVEKLTVYAKTQFGVDWNGRQGEAAFHTYLRERSSGVLQLMLSGIGLPALEQSATQTDFIVNAFIRNLNDRDPDGFEFLKTIVRGSILANVLLYPNLEAVGQDFDNVEFYFDTKFLLAARSWIVRP